MGAKTAHRVCAICLTPLYPCAARPSDEGWIHADDLGCTIIAARLALEPLSEVLTRLFLAGSPIDELATATGLSARVIDRHLKVARTQEEDIAYIGGWKRVGMVWKPRKRAAA